MGLVVTHLSVLVNIEAFLLNTLVDAQAVDILDSEEQDDTTGSSPEVDDQYAEYLSTEEAPAVSI